MFEVHGARSGLGMPWEGRHQLTHVSSGSTAPTAGDKRKPAHPAEPPTKRQRQENYDRSMSGKVVVPDVKPMTFQCPAERQDPEDKGTSSHSTPGNLLHPRPAWLTTSHQGCTGTGPAGPKAHKPWALILFSGRSRPSDLQHALCEKGWRRDPGC